MIIKIECYRSIFPNSFQIFHTEMHSLLWERLCCGSPAHLLCTMSLQSSRAQKRMYRYIFTMYVYKYMLLIYLYCKYIYLPIINIYLQIYIYNKRYFHFLSSLQKMTKCMSRSLKEKENLIFASVPLNFCRGQHEKYWIIPKRHREHFACLPEDSLLR